MRSLFSGLLISGLLLCCELFTSPAKLGSLWQQLTPVSQTVPTIAPTVIGQADKSLAAMEQAVHTQINQYRASRGLPSLALDARISQQARLHSQNMASKQSPFSHQGFQQRVQAIAQSISYRAAAENVAYNQGYQDPAKQSVQGWIKSTGHRQNIEGQFNLTGVGVAKNSRNEYYFTQVFIRGR